MRYLLAPMEGVTGAIYRRTVHEFLCPFDAYYTPFLTPTRDHIITKRQWSEIDPEQNSGMNLIPQILCNSAELFLWMAEELAALGYREVNLNLGCPSGTVVKKKKGSGLLGEPELLEQMLDEIFSHTPIAVSIKTRLGLHSDEEFEALLALYNRYPLCELIVHPRVQRDLYRGDVHLSSFEYALKHSRTPVCYNGDLFAPEDVTGLTAKHPELNAIMLGRGVIANSGLFGYIKNGAWITAAQLKELHDLLYARYRSAMPGRKPTLAKMWELWAFWECMFDSPEKPLKRIRKADSFTEYEAAVEELFRSRAFVPDGVYFAG